MEDDVTKTTSVDQLAPGWFWNVVRDARQDENAFSKLTDEQLIHFSDTMESIQSYFFHPALEPPDKTEDATLRAAAWVVSQGKEFFVEVWSHPQKFHEIYESAKYEKGTNFEWSAATEWSKRHEGDIPSFS